MGLTDRQAIAVELRSQGLTHAQIGQKIDRCTSAVTRLLLRADEAIRQESHPIRPTTSYRKAA